MVERNVAAKKKKPTKKENTLNSQENLSLNQNYGEWGQIRFISRSNLTDFPEVNFCCLMI